MNDSFFKDTLLPLMKTKEKSSGQLAIERRLIDINELSQWIGVCVNTIYGYVSQRKIPFVKVCGAVRFDVKEIEKWLESQKVKPIEF